MTVVISPLISLITDQVQKLVSHQIEAASLAGGSSQMELQRVREQLRSNQLKLVYVTPEMVFLRLLRVDDAN